MKNSKTNIDKYSGFGLRENWLNGFFQNINNYFEIEHGLGTKQVPAVINWLRDAELLNRADKNSSEIGLILAKSYSNKPNFVWELIWINLAYNSSIVNWYVSEINWNVTLQKSELEATLFNSYPNFRERTLHNGLEALTNMFKESKIGNELEIGLVKKTGQTSFVTKKSYEKIDVVSIAYSLYRYANSKKRYNLTVSELYAPEQKQGIYKEFGVSKERFQNILRTLQENKNGIVKVDLVMGLDNISLREDLTYTEVLKLLLEK